MSGNAACPSCMRVPESGGRCDSCGAVWEPDERGTLQRVSCPTFPIARDTAGAEPSNAAKTVRAFDEAAPDRSAASRRKWLMIWVVTTAWGVYSCPEHAVRFYSKKIRRRVFGYTSQVGESADPAIIMWPRGDSIWLPLFVVEKIERKLIEVSA